MVSVRGPFVGINSQGKSGWVSYKVVDYAATTTLPFRLLFPAADFFKLFS